MKRTIVIILVLILGGCKSSTEPEPAGEFGVLYVATGSAKIVKISYRASNGSSNWANNASLPWRKVIRANKGQRVGFHVIFADSLGPIGSSRSVTATLIVDDTTIQTASSRSGIVEVRAIL